MNNDIYLAKILLFCILGYFFILTEISVIQLLIIAYSLVYLWGFLAFVIFIALLFIGLIYFILRSGRWMFFFSTFICIIACFGFVFLFIIQKSSFTELIPKVILMSLFLAGLILIRFKIIPHSYKIFLRLINIGSSVGLIILTYQRPFFLTKVVLLALYLLSYESLKASFNNLEYRKESHFILLLQNHLTKYFLIFIILFPTITLFASANYIEIRANTSPEIIFWSGATQTPTDEATLDLCYENDIGFCVILREHYIDDGGLEEKEHLEYLLNHSVITYICIGGGKDEFYLTTDNGDDFYDIFHTIRSWLISNNLYNEALKGFVVDAEIPKSYYTDLENKDIYQKGEYYVNQLPTKSKLDKIQENLNKMIEEIQEDEKTCGIIMLPTMFDNLDLDDDYNLLSNTIYALDLDWDFSVSMNYRTMHIPTVWDYLIRDMNEYDYTSDYEPAYLQKEQLERNIIPKSQFYQEVCYEQHHSDVNVKENHRYIFIGTFTSKFKHTSYIQEDGWKEDIDICRHLGVSKIFFYEWSGFKRFYNLESLIRHNNNRQKWALIIPTFFITRELSMAMIIIIADKFLSI